MAYESKDGRRHDSQADARYSDYQDELVGMGAVPSDDLTIKDFLPMSSSQKATASATAIEKMEMYQEHNGERPYAWIKTINAGETVIRTGKTTDDGKWTQVKQGITKGWVETRFLGVN